MMRALVKPLKTLANTPIVPVVFGGRVLDIGRVDCERWLRIEVGGKKFLDFTSGRTLVGITDDKIVQRPFNESAELIRDLKLSDTR